MRQGMGIVMLWWTPEQTLAFLKQASTLGPRETRYIRAAVGHLALTDLGEQHVSRLRSGHLVQSLPRPAQPL